MVSTGIDQIGRKEYQYLKKLRLGLIVNASSVNARLEHTAQVFIGQKFNVTCLFSPEHGLWGVNQDQVIEGHTIDQQTGLKVFSLYGKHRKPTPDMLRHVDVLVYDVQDIGTRYYTFIWTMALSMEACAACGKTLVVIDRPNPLGGAVLEGPVLDMRFRSFVGMYPVPVRHGFTVGEAALWLQARFFPQAKVEVVTMRGWRRAQWFDQTGLPWVMPSPNMPTLDTAMVYPGMCLIEGTNLSEGRGVTRPFEICGAPWIDPFRLQKEIGREKLPGCAFRPLYFKPTFHKFKEKACGGLQIYVTDRDMFQSFRTGVALLWAVWHLYPKQAAWRVAPYEDESTLRAIDILAGNAIISRAVETHRPLKSLVEQWRDECAVFRRERAPFLLYR
jgi:uncharacterized protein YbbC (DUF1343 family)